MPSSAARASSASACANVGEPAMAMPERSPFTSARNTGTPAAEKSSARPCRVTVLPVPVAPAISPWRLALASSSICRSPLAPSPRKIAAIAEVLRSFARGLARGLAIDKDRFGGRAQVMAETKPFVLLDDARAEGASDAHLFENPREVFVARRPEDVLPLLEAADAARRATGGTLAGYLAYEAGLALEPRLAPLAAARSGATGSLLWFGLFDDATIIPAAEVPQWLADRAGGGL